MQHTEISVTRLVFWAVLILLEALVGSSIRRRDLSFLRNYLLIESGIGASLWILSRTIPPWPYFSAWCVGTILDEAAAAYLLGSIFARIRRGALPGREGLGILTWSTFLSLALGIYTSGLINLLAQSIWRLILSWDHAFWCAMCCMAAFLPFYVWRTFSTLRGLGTIFGTFAVFTVVHAGLFDLLVMRGKQGALVWLSDLTFLLCIAVWFFLSRAQPVAARAVSSQSLDPGFRG